jgi:chromosome segregation ATPase
LSFNNERILVREIPLERAADKSHNHAQGDDVSDNPTQEMPDSSSFEERVFARFDTMDARLTTLEDKVDTRLRETRPLWEAMQADLANVKDDLTSVKSDLSSVKGDVKEIKNILKVLHKDILRVRGEQEELDERVEKLESQSTH